ncbi:MAG: TonB-dependent receptor [Candidatus Cloacimonetes bacterium]|nr:TonB-dependent receptor [Candidatus Cloacimonadota bacterium]
MQKKIIVFTALLILLSIPLFAGTTGKLAGKVVDQDGNPVAFANIFFEGTEIGAQSKENGNYIIINIPPGTYDLQCSRGGFQTHKITGVRINIDETTIQNITLQKASIQIEGIQVSEARIEMVRHDKTNSGNTITAETIEDLTVDDIEGIIAIQAGATVVGNDLHIRGGRANEVVYSIDGLSVSDPVDGGAALTIDRDAIKDMKVMTGGFTAEYGNAQSGIVNIITKDGGKEYTGKIEMNTDHLIDAIDHSNSDNFKFALGGPVLGPIAPSLREKFTFFFNAAANWHDSRYWEYYESSPNEELTNDGTNWLVSEYEAYEPYMDRDDFIGFDLGSRNYNLYNANLKVKYVFNARQNLTLAVRGDQNNWYPYVHGWKYSLENYAEAEDNQRQYIATYDHLFPNNVMNLKVKASYYQKNSYQSPRGINRDDYFVRSPYMIWEDPSGFNPYYSLSDINTSGIYILSDNGVREDMDDFLWAYYLYGSPLGINQNDFLQPGSIYRFNIDDKNETYTLRSDFEYQLNRIHGFKTGFEIMKHTIIKDQLRDPWVIDPLRYQTYLDEEAIPFDSVEEGDPIIDNWEGSPTYGETILSSAPEDMNFYLPDDLYNAIIAASGSRDGYEAEPWQAAYYVQDKMEWEGMIVNAGVRFDFWYLGEKYKVFRDANRYEWVEFDKDKRYQLMISPRLGVSHPISETTVMHFAYNYQNQLPQMQYIFTSVTPEDAIISDANITIGKLDLEPQITVTYEVGLQKQFGEDYVIDLTAYYKNIYNYVSTVKYYLQDDGSLIPWYEVEPGDETVDITTDLYGYISENYGSTRGIDFNLQKMLSNFISGSLSYSLGWAEGNDSEVNDTQDEDTKLREFPLDWDIRHSASANISFKIAKGEEFYFPFTGIKFPLDDFSLNFLYSIASGRPYTRITLQDTEMDTNQERMPFTETADLKISKRISFSDKVNLKIYCDIENIFNRRNINTVYQKTGSPYYDGADISLPNGYTPEETQYLHDLATKNPTNWTQGRTITFGFAFNW